MSPRLRIWGACRALAIQSRPAALRPESFLTTIPRNQWYSTEGNNPPRNPIDNARKPEELQSQSTSNDADVAKSVDGKDAAEVGIEVAIGLVL